MKTLCVNGWAQPHDGLTALAQGYACHLDYGPCRDFDEATARIAERSPEVDLAVGWSLGGAILLDALRRKRLRTRHIVLLAPALQFVATADFPQAMDPLTFRLFRENYAAHPLRTARRFQSLILKGDSHATQLLRSEMPYPEAAQSRLWLKWLDSLAERSFSDFIIDDDSKILVVHGENDFIVPFSQSVQWRKINPRSMLLALSGCGHAPHWHDPSAVREGIARLVA